MIRIRVDNKKFLYQVLLFVIISNLTVYLLTSKTETVVPTKTPKDFLEIIVKLKLFVPFEKLKKVTLYLPNKNIYISEVYLYKNLRSSPLESKIHKDYIVKTSSESLKKILLYKGETFEVYPEKTKILQLTKKTRRKYEILY